MRGPLELPELSGEERLTLQLVLVRQEDSTVQALRLLSLSPEVSRALLEAIKAQETLPQDYDERIARVYNRYAPAELARKAVRCRGGA